MSVRAVFDRMICLQAATRPDRIHGTFRLVFEGEVELCLSPDVLGEIRDVLTRPRHAEKFPALTARNVDAFIAGLLRHARLVEPVPANYVVARDPKDSKYVDLAIAANAKYLVTWDHHLLDLMDPRRPEGQDFLVRYPDLQIVQPPTFLQAVQPQR